MKYYFQNIIFIGLFIITTNFLIAQDCKYKVNNVDKFTKKLTIQTKSRKVIANLYDKGLFCFQKIDTSYSLILDFEKSDYSDFLSISIVKGAQLIFILENKEKITVNCSNDYNSKRTSNKNAYSTEYICSLTNVIYSLSKTQVETFSKSPLVKVRWYRNEGNGQDQYIDIEIKDKFQTEIQELTKCVL